MEPSIMYTKGGEQKTAEGECRDIAYILLTPFVLVGMRQKLSIILIWICQSIIAQWYTGA